MRERKKLRIISLLQTISIAVFLAAAFGASGCSGHRHRVLRILATGDAPYSEEQTVRFKKFLKQAADDDFDFLIHVGDIKGQGEPCSDARLEATRDLFRSYPTPIVYTPGDNEWTDCGGEAAGSFDPVERLVKLRQLMFADPDVLRLAALGAEHQSEQPQHELYTENFRFFKSGVLFVVAHVAGSNNGRNEESPAMMQEFKARDQATVKFLKESFTQAIERRASGVVVVIHANPDFEQRTHSGHQKFVETIEAFARRTDRPLLCVHGDTHYFRIDKPLRDTQTRRRFLHFTRLEVFGAPEVAGVVITVDTEDPHVFSFEPYYLR